MCKQDTLQIRAYHLVQKATALNLEDIAVFIGQHIQPGDGLDGIIVGLANVGKVCEIMLPQKQLGSLPVNSSMIRQDFIFLSCRCSIDSTMLIVQ